MSAEPRSERELLRRVGRLEQVAGVRLVTLGDGTERGMRVLEFRSGSGLCFEVLVDRCMDIGRADLAGRSLAWLSPAGAVGPWYAEPRGLGWFRTWNGGLLTTCGLDHTLLGGVDTAGQYHQDCVPTVEYGLHGRVGALPARLVGYGESWDDEGCLLWAEGVVRQAAVFGECLELHRRIEVRLGSSTLRVADEVTNAGFDPTPHMYLYHVNVGWPLLDHDARLLLPAPAGTPTGAWQVDGDYRVMTGPQPAFREQCYEHAMAHEADGTVPVAIANDALELGLYQLYDGLAMPFHTTWRMLGEGTYSVALEPTTNRDAGRFDAIERGELLWLQPGERRRYRLDIGILDGADDIARFTRRVEAITPVPSSQHPTD